MTVYEALSTLFSILIVVPVGFASWFIVLKIAFEEISWLIEDRRR